MQYSPRSHTEKEDEYENDPFEDVSKDDTESERHNGHQPSSDESSEHEQLPTKPVVQEENGEEAISKEAVSRKLSSLSSHSKYSRRSSSTSSCHSVQSSSSSNSDKSKHTEEKTETAKEEQDREEQNEKMAQNSAVVARSVSIGSDVLSSPGSSSSIHTAHKKETLLETHAQAKEPSRSLSRAGYSESDVSLGLPEGNTTEGEEETKQEITLESGRINRLGGKIPPSTEMTQEDSKRSQDSNSSSEGEKNLTRQEVTEFNEKIEVTAKEEANGEDKVSTRLARQEAVPHR